MRYRHVKCVECKADLIAPVNELVVECDSCEYSVEVPPIEYIHSLPGAGWSDTRFEPHFDYQLGRHFNNADEKRNFLKASGKEQTDGFASPKDRASVEKKGRPIMTRAQFDKWKKVRKAKAAASRYSEEKQHSKKLAKQADNKKISIITP